MASKNTKLNIVGICGLPRSGKDMLAGMFMESGFFGVSLGDIFRNITRERHADKPDPISRVNMLETGLWLRQTKGPDFALKEAIKQFEVARKTKDYIGLLVYSVRSPVEIDFILQKKGRIIWIEASDQTRYDRYLKALRKGEIEVDLAEFKRQEDLEWKPNPDLPKNIQMNISYVKDHATDIIENNFNTLIEFHKRALSLIDQI